MINVKGEAIIDKKIEDVWEIMGNQFAKVHVWCSNFKTSKPGGPSKFSGLNYSHRDTTTNRGQTIQELDKFDPDKYILSYHISKGIPPIAKTAIGNWSLKSLGENKTTVIIEFEVDPKNFIVSLLTPIIKKKLSTAAREIAEELKYYLENDKPHPRKEAL
ncbi:MAG: hypothetical protein COA58_11405 [Bacteroidetes bacterium]|nr:MAG: hypothetical protein COA58_11405 [Bacteroidota bacterium]